MSNNPKLDKLLNHIKTDQPITMIEIAMALLDIAAVQSARIDALETRLAAVERFTGLRVDDAPAVAPTQPDAKAVRLTKAQRKQLELVASHELNYRRVKNNAPRQHRDMVAMQDMGLVEFYVDGNGRLGPVRYWRITEQGRRALVEAK